MTLNSKIPAGPIEKKWEDYKGHVKLVNPANKRKLEISKRRRFCLPFIL